MQNCHLKPGVQHRCTNKDQLVGDPLRGRTCMQPLLACSLSTCRLSLFLFSQSWAALWPQSLTRLTQASLPQPGSMHNMLPLGSPKMRASLQLGCCQKISAPHALLVHLYSSALSQAGAPQQVCTPNGSNLSDQGGTLAFCQVICGASRSLP